MAGRRLTDLLRAEQARRREDIVAQRALTETAPPESAAPEPGDAVPQ